MNTTAKFHLTAAAFGVLIASSVYAETNQVYSNTVQAHNAPMTVDVIMKDGKIVELNTAAQIFTAPQNDYTKLLIEASL